MAATKGMCLLVLSIAICGGHHSPTPSAFARFRPSLVNCGVSHYWRWQKSHSQFPTRWPRLFLRTSLDLRTESTIRISCPAQRPTKTEA